MISNPRRPSDTVVVYSASRGEPPRVSLSCDPILRDRLGNSLSSKVLIKDSRCIISNLDLLDYRFDWPNEDWKLLSTRCGWRNWSPKVGLEGEIVHKWSKKAIAGEKTIFLLRVLNGRYYVPVDESDVNLRITTVTNINFPWIDGQVSIRTLTVEDCVNKDQHRRSFPFFVMFAELSPQANQTSLKILGICAVFGLLKFLLVCKILTLEAKWPVEKKREKTLAQGH
uniref:Uncharacterized protein n=1 Tax=Romanomermis culicivorax TaxID=13658 RepID=A0A915L390_ROMCU